MPSESPSSNTTSRGRGRQSNKRVRLAVAADANGSGSPPPPARNLTPLEAAKATAGRWIATLHEGLQPFIRRHVETLLHAYASYTHKDRKHNEMLQDPGYTPRNVRFAVNLQVVEEVRQSEGYIALEGELQAEVERMQRQLATYALRAHDFSRLALLDRLRKSFFVLLVEAAKAFIAQHNVENYGPHLAAMDLFVKFPTRC